MNSQGFRVRTEGIDLANYPKNPLLLFHHKMPKGESQHEILPLGNGLDLEVKDGKLYSTPAFDTSDQFATSIMNKVENGTIRMASAGLRPKTWRIVDGEKWLWESELVEWSITPRGANPEAYAVALYNEEKELISLTEDYWAEVIPETNIPNMKKIELTGKQLNQLLKLSEDAQLPEEVSQEQATAAIEEVVQLAETQAQTIVTLKADLKDANDKVTEKENEIVQLKANEQDAKIETLCQGAVEAKKITADQKEQFVKLAKQDFDGVKEIIEKMPAHKSIEEQLNLSDDDSNELAELVKLSWDDLDKGGKLARLKELDANEYEKKFKKKFPGG